jgi:predicted nucleic acid-binding Zn ribbon protein
MSEIRSSEPELLGSIINKFLHETGMDETIAEAAMPDVWSEVVGEKISAVTQVQSFAKGRLTVSTPSSTWRAELMLRKQDLITRLNHKLQRQAVKELIIR